MRVPHITLAAATLASAAFAQPITTPANFNAVEGNANFSFWGPNRRMMGIDASNPTPAVWNRISYRRDGTAAFNAAYVTRTFDFQVKMGPVDWNRISNEFDNNYSQPPTTVYTLKPTTFPDWTNPPTTPPAPFDMTAVFDVPYVHLGGTFAWDMEMTNSTVTGLVVMDRHYNGYASATGTAIGTGCVATGRVSAFAQTAYLRNGGASTGQFGMHLRVACTNAPSNAPILVSLDGVNSNLSVPFLCGTLYAFPTVILPIGTSDAAGLMRDVHLGFPHNPFLIGATFFTQLVAPDLGQPVPFVPIALSNARQTTMPGDLAAISQTAAYIWATLPTNNSTVFFGGCPVAELQ